MPLIVEFLEENEPIGTGGFRTACRTKTKHPQFSSRKWVVKRYIQNTIKGIHDLGQTVEQHTRKVVQMHLLARNFASQLEKRIERWRMPSASVSSIKTFSMVRLTGKKMRRDSSLLWFE